MSRTLKDVLEGVDIIICPECKKVLRQSHLDKSLMHCIYCAKSYWLKEVKKSE